MKDGQPLRIGPADDNTVPEVEWATNKPAGQRTADHLQPPTCTYESDPHIENQIASYEASRADAFQEGFNEILGNEILTRRRAQDMQWGGPAHDDTHGPTDWIIFIRSFCEKHDLALFGDIPAKPGETPQQQCERYLIDIAALAIAAIQSSRRKLHENPSNP